MRSWQVFRAAHLMWYKAQNPDVNYNQLWTSHMKADWNRLSADTRNLYTPRVDGLHMVANLPPPHANGNAVPPVAGAAQSQATVQDQNAAQVPTIQDPARDQTVEVQTAAVPNDVDVDISDSHFVPPLLLADFVRAAKPQIIEEFKFEKNYAARLTENVTAQHGRWVPTQEFGSGTFGRATLWVKVDDKNVVRDRMVGKDVNLNENGSWFSVLYWADGEIFQTPKEVFLHRLACQRGNKSPFIVGYRGFHVLKELRVFRIATEYAPYGMMDALLPVLRRESTVPLRLMLELFAALVSACQHISDLHIVHRDLKPKNVFMSGEETGEFHGWKFKPLLGDFGVAIQDDSPQYINPTGYDVMGTPGFYAPEQARVLAIDGAPPMGEKTNVFGLAMTMFNLIQNVSKPDHTMGPWAEGVKAPENSQRELSTLESFFANEELDELYTELRHIIIPCLRWAPADRPTFAELKVQIQTALDGLGDRSVNVTDEMFNRLNGRKDVNLHPLNLEFRRNARSRRN